MFTHFLLLMWRGITGTITGLQHANIYFQKTPLFYSYEYNIYGT